MPWIRRHAWHISYGIYGFELLVLLVAWYGVYDIVTPTREFVAVMKEWVPSIGKHAGISPFPDAAALYYSVGWALLPVLVGLALVAPAPKLSQHKDERVLERVLRKSRGTTWGGVVGIASTLKSDSIILRFGTLFLVLAFCGAYFFLGPEEAGNPGKLVGQQQAWAIFWATLESYSAPTLWLVGSIFFFFEAMMLVYSIALAAILFGVIPARLGLTSIREITHDR